MRRILPGLTDVHYEIADLLENPKFVATPKSIRKSSWGKAYDNSSTISLVNRELNIGVSRLVSVMSPDVIASKNKGFRMGMSSDKSGRIIIMSSLDEEVLNEKFGYTHLLTIARQYSHPKAGSAKSLNYGKEGVAISMGLWGINPMVKKDKIGVYWGPIDDKTFKKICEEHIVPDTFHYIKSFESLKK